MVSASPFAFDGLLAARLGHVQAAPVTTGESGGHVFRLSAPGAPARYLKQGRGAVADDLTHEMVRLQWVAGWIPVPRVLAFAREHDRAELLTSALPGVPAAALLEAQPAARAETVRALARFLRRLHAIPLDDCPFDARAPLRLAAAHRRLEAGLVDEDDFDAVRAGQSAEQVWATLQALLPLPFERVVTHGDFSLDNVFVHDGEVTGCLDVGRLGVADPYQDLAILANNLSELDESLVGELFRAYGDITPDPARLAFHQLLDEFF